MPNGKLTKLIAATEEFKNNTAQLANSSKVVRPTGENLRDTNSNIDQVNQILADELMEDFDQPRQQLKDKANQAMETLPMPNKSPEISDVSGRFNYKAGQARSSQTAAIKYTGFVLLCLATAALGAFVGFKVTQGIISKPERFLKALGITSAIALPLPIIGGFVKGVQKARENKKAQPLLTTNEL